MKLLQTKYGRNLQTMPAISDNSNFKNPLRVKARSLSTNLCQYFINFYFQRLSKYADAAEMRTHMCKINWKCHKFVTSVEISLHSEITSLSVRHGKTPLFTKFRFI